MKCKSVEVFWKSGFRIAIGHLDEEANLKNLCPKIINLKTKKTIPKKKGVDSFRVDNSCIPHKIYIEQNCKSLYGSWDKSYTYLIHRTIDHKFDYGTSKIIITTLENVSRYFAYIYFQLALLPEKKLKRGFSTVDYKLTVKKPTSKKRRAKYER